MPVVLCFDCGGTFEVDYDTPNPTKRCPKCLDKMQNKMMNVMFGDEDFYKTQETFE